MKKLVVFMLCFMVGVSGLTACNKSAPKETKKEVPAVKKEEKEEKVDEDTFVGGQYTTKDYKVLITKTGTVDGGKLIVEYTFENLSSGKMSADEVWGYTMKVMMGEEQLQLTKLSDDYAPIYDSKIDTLHSKISSGDSVDGMLVFDLPEQKTSLDEVYIKALNTETNKAISKYVIELVETHLNSVSENSIKASDITDEEAEELPEEKNRTGADEALESTEKDINQVESEEE